MKYALISDIHANLPALEAVLADIARRGIEQTFHLGDLVGYAPWPNETVKMLDDAGIAGVSGNYDSTVATDYKHCGCRYEDPVQERLSHLSYEWTLAHVSPATTRSLAALPFRIDLLPNGGHQAGPRVVLVHGTPTLNTLYWTEDRSDEFCLKMASQAGARPGDVLAFGHTHKPWAREIGGVQFVNAGSEDDVVAISNIVSPALASEQIGNGLRLFLPTGMVSPLQNDVSAALEQAKSFGIFAVAGLAWSALGLFSNLTNSLDLIFHVPASRSLWRQRIVALLMTLILIILVIASFITSGVLNLIWAFLGSQPNVWISLGRIFLPMGLDMVIFALLFRPGASTTARPEAEQTRR